MREGLKLIGDACTFVFCFSSHWEMLSLREVSGRRLDVFVFLFFKFCNVYGIIFNIQKFK